MNARIETSDGCILSGITEHRDTPAEAVRAFLTALKTVPLDQVIVTNGPAGRRHWRWNGAAFTEEPVEWLRDKVAASHGQEATDDQ